MTDHELAEKEERLIQQKDQRAVLRKMDEDKKVHFVKKRLERQKE